MNKVAETKSNDGAINKIQPATALDLLTEEFLEKTKDEKLANRLAIAALFFANKNKDRSEEK